MMMTTMTTMMVVIVQVTTMSWLMAMKRELAAGEQGQGASTTATEISEGWAD